MSQKKIPKTKPILAPTSTTTTPSTSGGKTTGSPRYDFLTKISSNKNSASSESMCSKTNPCAVSDKPTTWSECGSVLNLVFGDLGEGVLFWFVGGSGRLVGDSECMVFCFLKNCFYRNVFYSLCMHISRMMRTQPFKKHHNDENATIQKKLETE